MTLFSRSRRWEFGGGGFGDIFERRKREGEGVCACVRARERERRDDRRRWGSRRARETLVKAPLIIATRSRVYQAVYKYDLCPVETRARGFHGATCARGQWKRRGTYRRKENRTKQSALDRTTRAYRRLRINLRRKCSFSPFLSLSCTEESMI